MARSLVRTLSVSHPCAYTLLLSLLLLSCCATFSLAAEDTTVTTAGDVQTNATTSTSPKPNPKSNANSTARPKLDLWDEKAVVQTWVRMEKKLKNGIRSILRKAFPQIISLATDAKVSGNCSAGILKLIVSLRHLKTWAIQMIDAIGKPPSGLLEGSMMGFGHYQQCVNVLVMDDDVPDKEFFRGKYCNLEIKPPLPMPKPRFYGFDNRIPALMNISSPDSVFGLLTEFAHFFYFMNFRVDICVPSTCTIEDIKKVGKIISNLTELMVDVPRCEIKEDHPPSNDQITAMTIFCILIVIIILGTTVDIVRRLIQPAFSISSLSKSTRALLSFSLFTNVRSLLDPETSDPKLRVLHGMRVITLGWIIMVHTFCYINFQIYGNLMSAKDIALGFIFQMVTNGSIAVDSFILLSAVTSTYIAFKYARRDDGSVNIPFFVFHRFWRLTWPLVFVILLTFLLPNLGSGPVWNQTIEPLIENCRRNWWANLLYVNNFFPPENACLEHTWLMCNEIQFFIIFIPLVLLLFRLPTVGLSLTMLLTVASVVSTALLTTILNYPPTMLFTLPDPIQRNEFFLNIYYMPYTHLAVYCIGTLVGYLIIKKPELKVKMSHNIIGWIVVGILSSLVVFGTHKWVGGTLPENPISALYASTHRLAWALCMAWIVYVCVTGQGGIINQILSFKVLIPLSRVVYLGYLLHPLIQKLFTAIAVSTYIIDVFMALYVFIGHMVVTFTLAFVLTVACDSPFRSLGKLLCPEACTSKSEDIHIMTEKGPSKEAHSSNSLHASSTTKLQEMVGRNGKFRAHSNGDV